MGDHADDLMFRELGNPNKLFELQNTKLQRKERLISNLNSKKRKIRNPSLPEFTVYQNGYDVGWNQAIEMIIEEYIK